MLNKDTARQWLQEKTSALYTPLQQGMDVSPGDRLRLEGQVELLLHFELLTWPCVQQIINALYQQHFQQAIADNVWQWMHDDQRFYLPVKMQEAPVYKTS